MRMKNIIDYIIRFLLHGHDEAAQYVGYTADRSLWHNYKVVIPPCGHLAKDWVLPDMESPHIIQAEGSDTLVIDKDIVYNTLFFISRAEELINPQRDEHGRFAARFSILGTHNRMLIPIVDEYSDLLVKALDLTPCEQRIAKTWLTHDVDTLSQYRSLRGTIGGLRRGEFGQLAKAWRNLKSDPAYTFPWLIKQDAAVAGAESIYFVKITSGKGLDYPQYNLSGCDYRQTRRLLLDSGARLGLHSSCYGTLPEQVPAESGIDMRLHRSHYLCCSLKQMQRLCDAGVTDDFTMGFADMAGFRLQTSRPFRWINPETMQLTGLTLHPLIVMDATLNAPHYMGLSEDEAYFFAEQLIRRTRLHNGEATLLWHNSNINTQTYHRSLYPKLLQLL